jgi:4-hydroxybenzoate polyprenyltransferase
VTEVTDAIALRTRAQAQSPPALPLVVDLDGTLVLTDTLFESIGSWMRTRPAWTLLQLIQLPFAIARVKARLQRGADIDVETLPVNADVLTYCREAKALGRKVWLVTAADQSVADRIATRFGIFDRAIGSDGKTNNKSLAKARRLTAELPGGFEYVGDSRADFKVWNVATAASHVGGGVSRTHRIERSNVPVVRSFERPKAGLSAWRKAMRLHQWAKNALIFAAPVLAMEFRNPQVMLACALGFLALGLLASGTYIVNDLLDLRADRRHHSKHKRPFASGRIKLWQGFLAAPLLIVGGFGAGAAISLPFAGLMLVYLTLTLSYSLALKRAPLLDAVVLGFLYTLRLMMGGVLAAVPVTQWLLVFSMFLFLSLSLAKRHVEVVRKAAAGENQVASRGYRAEDAPLTLGLGLATATASPLILVLYLIDSAWPSGHFLLPEALWSAPLVLALWLMRVWLLANRSELDDDPVTFAVRDPQSLALGVFLVASFVIAVFGLPMIDFGSLFQSVK